MARTFDSFKGALKMKTVYLIGSSGFLGSNLKNEFSQDHKVITAQSYNLVNEFSNWLDLILRDLLAYRPDVVLLPAASQNSGDDRAAVNELIQSNCMLPSIIASQLLENELDAKLVVFGTSWQFSDSDQYRPFNFYAATKQACEDLLEHYALRGLKCASLLLFDTFGAGDDRKKLLNLLIHAALTDSKLGITPGDQQIDLVEITDVCRGVRNCIGELDDWDTAGGVLKRGLGSGNPLKVKELVDEIKKIFGQDVNIELGKRNYRDREVMRVYQKYTPPKNWDVKATVNDFLKALT